MTQKDKLRESFLALVSIKSTANNIIDYCYQGSVKYKTITQEDLKTLANILNKEYNYN